MEFESNAVFYGGRVINRAPGLKLVVMTLLSSLRPIGNVVLICCTFFVIFGILGIQVIPHEIVAKSSDLWNCLHFRTASIIT